MIETVLDFGFLHSSFDDSEVRIQSTKPERHEAQHWTLGSYRSYPNLTYQLEDTLQLIVLINLVAILDCVWLGCGIYI